MDSQKKKITIIISSIAIFLLMVAAVALFWIFSKKSKEPFNFEQARILHWATSFDLHVLGMPPAFILSQDQTLNKIYFLFWFVQFS